VGVGTPVHIVDQPVLAGWRDGQLYLEAHPPLSEYQRDPVLEAGRVIEAALQRAGRPDADIDAAAVAWVLAERSGIPFPVLEGATSPGLYLARARIVVSEPRETAGTSPAHLLLQQSTFSLSLPRVP
ncbi:MAG TPA: hypothetical protein VK827_10840, partial [Lysobacter sp.]|nr:hypothetical protein [Lysobacter sp.]